MTNQPNSHNLCLFRILHCMTRVAINRVLLPVNGYEIRKWILFYASNSTVMKELREINLLLVELRREISQRIKSYKQCFIVEISCLLTNSFLNFSDPHRMSRSLLFCWKYIEKRWSYQNGCGKPKFQCFS